MIAMTTPEDQLEKQRIDKHRSLKYEYRPNIRNRAAMEKNFRDIAKHGHVLTPGRYVSAEDIEEYAEPFAEKCPRLVAEVEEVEECLAEGERLANVIRSQLGRIEHV